MSPPTRPNGVATVARSACSPCPQMRRSGPVSTSLRCRCSSFPSGPNTSSELYSVPPPGSISFTPTARWTSCSAAISPSSSAAAPGITTAWSTSMAYSAVASVSQGLVLHTHSGNPGTNASGRTTSDAPSAAAAAVSSRTRAMVASRSRNTGVACTAATLNVDTTTTSLTPDERRRRSPSHTAATRRRAVQCVRPTPSWQCGPPQCSTTWPSRMRRMAVPLISTGSPDGSTP